MYVFILVPWQQCRYDVDTFTQEYYRTNYGFEDFTPIDVSSSYQLATPLVLYINLARCLINFLLLKEIPKHNGFGTEEDSLISCLSLVPKPIKRDIQKTIDNDKKILRFGAKLASKTPEDAARMFIISYFLADDTISVYEPPMRYTNLAIKSNIKIKDNLNSI